MAICLFKKKRVDYKVKIIQEYVIILEFQSPGIPWASGIEEQAG